MSFNPTLDIGDILKFVGMLLAALWFISKMSGRLDMVTAEIKALKDNVAAQSQQMVKFAEALIEIARQDERLDALDRRLEDLSRGQGFKERDVNGEYMRAGKVR
jgi:division protein CdvB (Snf7/Vps24/ESCRT-III family)